MKILTTILSALAAVLLLASPARAQSYTISHTSLNGAVTQTATVFILTSAAASTGSSFGAPAVSNCLMVEGEMTRILAVSSTSFTVQRAAAGGDPADYGTAGGATAHPTGAIVWTAPCNAFKQAEPPGISNGLGAAQCTLQPAPWIDIKTANVWWCNTINNNWSGTNFAAFAYGSVAIAQ